MVTDGIVYIMMAVSATGDQGGESGWIYGACGLQWLELDKGAV